MNDEQIILKGGDDRDIEEYARQNGADLNEEDFKHNKKEKERFCDTGIPTGLEYL